MTLRTYSLVAAAAALLCLIAMPAPAAPLPSKVTGVVAKIADGDTLTVCDTGLSQIQQCHTIRVNNLNTPEKRLCKPGDTGMKQCEPCAKGARLGVIAAGEARRMAPIGSRVTLTVRGSDRYGRVVADVMLPNGTDWAKTMIARGNGAPYPCPNGHCAARPRPWCK